jgi:hypothetical protein
MVRSRRERAHGTRDRQGEPLAHRVTRTLSLLVLVVFSAMIGTRCGGGNSSSTKSPTAPTRPPAAFTITTFTVTTEQTSTEHRYTVHLGVRETGGQTGGTMGIVEVTMLRDASVLSTATINDAWQTAHLNGGGSMDAKSFTLGDGSVTATIANRLSIKINYVDDDQHSGSLTQTADVPQPPAAPAPSPSPAPANTVTLSCIVQDDATNGGLADATVQVLDGVNAGKSATSTSNGQCSLAGLTAGQCTVRVSRSGYRTLDKSVTLPSDSRIEFKLTANAAPTPPGGGGGGSDSMTCNGPVSGSASCSSPTAKCNDGTPSCSQNRSGTCSSHGGVACWVCPGALCNGLREHTSTWPFSTALATAGSAARAPVAQP